MYWSRLQGLAPCYNVRVGKCSWLKSHFKQWASSFQFQPTFCCLKGLCVTLLFLSVRFSAAGFTVPQEALAAGGAAVALALGAVAVVAVRATRAKRVGTRWTAGRTWHPRLSTASCAVFCGRAVCSALLPH